MDLRFPRFEGVFCPPVLVFLDIKMKFWEDSCAKTTMTVLPGFVRPHSNIKYDQSIVPQIQIIF